MNTLVSYSVCRAGLGLVRSALNVGGNCYNKPQPLRLSASEIGAT